MASSLFNNERRLLPEWRFLQRYEPERDIYPDRDVYVKKPARYLNEKRILFDADPNFYNAYELYLAASISGDVELRVKSLRFIESSSESNQRIIDSLSRNIKISTFDYIDKPSEQWAMAGVHSLRSMLKKHPRNPVVWLDLAWLYSSLGELDHAFRAAVIACDQAKENRIILRRAGRFFVHANDPERAHDLIERASKISSDPWLISAELSFSQVASRKSYWIKKIQGKIEKTVIPSDVESEMAASLGTYEDSRGAAQKAKKLFRKSLKNPDNNILAQVEWFKNKTGLVFSDYTPLSMDTAYEASAISSNMNGNWDESLSAIECWITQEPYSSRPYELASYVACIALGNYELSRNYISRGLKPNPNDVTLENNLLVCACLDMDLDYVKKNANRIIKRLVKEDSFLAWPTAGLVSFAIGDPVSGRKFYSDAISKFIKDKRKHPEILSKLFYANAEVVFGSKELSGKIISSVGEMEKLADREILLAMKARIENLYLD